VYFCACTVRQDTEFLTGKTMIFSSREVVPDQCTRPTPHALWIFAGFSLVFTTGKVWDPIERAGGGVAWVQTGFQADEGEIFLAVPTRFRPVQSRISPSRNEARFMENDGSQNNDNSASRYFHA
jgi:hypothetical protein